MSPAPAAAAPPLDLGPTPTYAARTADYAGDANNRNHQRKNGKSTENHGVQPIRGQHLRADVFEGRGALHGLIH